MLLQDLHDDVLKISIPLFRRVLIGWEESPLKYLQFFFELSQCQLPNFETVNGRLDPKRLTCMKAFASS